MTTRYIIEGNTVRKTEEQDLGTILLSDLLPQLVTYVPLEMSPLPRNIAYIKAEPQEGESMTVRVIISEPPHIQRINFRNRYEDGNGQNYAIAVPHSLFLFVMRSAQMFRPGNNEIIWTPQHWGAFWSRTPYSNLDMMVAPAGLPNCYPDGRICVGSTSVAANQSFGRFIDSAVNTFWTSVFNRDLSYPWPYGSMDEWQTASAENPDVWQEWTSVWGREQSLRNMLANLPWGTWNDPVPSSSDAEPIPAIPLAPSFHAVENWLTSLSANQRDRLREGLNAVA